MRNIYFYRCDLFLLFAVPIVHDIRVVLHIAHLFLDILHFLRLPGTFPFPSFVRLTDRWPRTIDRYKSIVCSQLANATQRGRDSLSYAGSVRGPLVSIRYIRQMNALCANARG